MNEPTLPHDLRALRRVVQEFMDERKWGRYHSPKNVAAALAIEAAELQEIYLWRDPDDPCDDKREQIEDEAADVLLCLLNFCNRAGVDIGPALLRKLDKAALKYPVETVRGRREKYDEY